MAAADYSGITAGINKQFDYQKQQAAQQENANRQNSQDALQRRQAQLGGGPGGALIGQEQQINNQSAQRLNNANQGIDTQRDQALQGVQMTQLGQQYQTSEREAGQQYQTSERGASQQFAAGQQQAVFGQQKTLQDAQIAAQQIMQDKGITAQSSLQDKQIAAQQLMQKTGIDAQAAQQLVGIAAQKNMQTASIQSQLQMQAQQQQFQQPFMEAQITGKYQGLDTLAQKQFDEQTGVDQFNEQIAKQMANKKDGLETLFGNFGTANPYNPDSFWKNDLKI